MPFLDHVRELRRRTGVKSGAFAAITRYSRAAIVSIENGTRPASPEGAERIAAALTDLGQKVTADDLIKTPDQRRGTVPDPPPKQPNKPTAPVRREKENKGPRRAGNEAAA
jgi:predicted transcriptional regulator